MRTTLKGKGISQEELANAVKTTANTNALISATADLDDRDLEEVTVYAQLRRAQQSRRRA